MASNFSGTRKKQISGFFTGVTPTTPAHGDEFPAFFTV
jgi:hypothetical protein